MKKSHELATLTGSQVMVLVASETGHVYTFSTQKFQPILNSKPGRKLIQTCLANESVDDTDIGELDLTDVDPTQEDEKPQDSPNSSSQSSLEMGEMSPRMSQEYRPLSNNLHLQRNHSESSTDEIGKASSEINPRMTHVNSIRRERFRDFPHEAEQGPRIAERFREAPRDIPARYREMPNHHIINQQSSSHSDDEQIQQLPEEYRTISSIPVLLRQTQLQQSTKEATEFEMTYLPQHGPVDPNSVQFMHKNHKFYKAANSSSHHPHPHPHQGKR